jgi:hypothetical protein
MTRQRKSAARPRGAKPPTPDARLGSVRAVLADVGNDAAKAQAAYDTEANSPSPRKSLLSSLRRIITRGNAE